MVAVLFIIICPTGEGDLKILFSKPALFQLAATNAYDS